MNINKNPFFNALFASFYIVLIVFVIDTFSGISQIQETLLIPMVMLSLFVISALVMGFLFGYEPIQLYLDNKRREAIIFFAKTLGYFVCLTIFFVAALLYSSFF